MPDGLVDAKAHGCGSRSHQLSGAGAMLRKHVHRCFQNIPFFSRCISTSGSPADTFLRYNQTSQAAGVWEH